MKKTRKRVFYEIGGDVNRCHVEAYIREGGRITQGIHESLLLAYGSRKDCERRTKEVAKESLFDYLTTYCYYRDELELI